MGDLEIRQVDKAVGRRCRNVPKSASHDDSRLFLRAVAFGGLLAVVAVSAGAAQSAPPSRSPSQASKSRPSAPADPQASKFQVSVRIQVAPEADKRVLLAWTETLREIGVAGVSEVPLATRPKDGEPAESAIVTAGPGKVLIHAALGPAGNLFIGSEGYRLADRGRLEALVKRLRAEGLPGPDPASPLWGLNQGQFELLRNELKPRGRFNLEDKPFAEFLAELQPRTKLAIKTTPEADALGRTLRLNTKTANLSLGASLAYVLGQHGLAFEPRADASGNVSLAVMPLSDSRRPWPVGLAPQQFPGNIAPQLLQPVRYQTDNTPLDELLTVIEGAIKIDVVLDRRALAVRDIDAAALRSTVAIPGGTLTSALRKTFAPLGLKHELRIDEADRPFLWITAGEPTGLAPKKKN